MRNVGVIADKKFSSKILLFGEYSVILNSMALLIPFPLFEGKLSFPVAGDGSESQQAQNELRAFCQYLQKWVDEETRSIPFDLSSFEFDLNQGLYFKSTIPHGYGVGSSGALCAALFDRYGDKNFNSIAQLNPIFAKMESHFHGKSSGLDPLVSYLNNPILKNNKAGISCVRLPDRTRGKATIFLVNTGRARRTEPLVHLFLEKCKNEEFSKSCTEKLTPLNNICISHFLDGNIESLVENFRELSAFQFENFAPMIPHLYSDLWKEGLETQNFSLKLCGAGGGGFLLGIAKDLNQVKEYFKNIPLRTVFDFH